MNRSKFFEVLLYSTGTGLGLIINLVTGDMGELYQQNKASIQVAGAILFGLGLIISIFKESESISQQSNKSGVSALSIIGTSIASTILCTIYGLIAGMAIYWGFFWVAKESAVQQPEIANFLNSGGYLRVVPAIVGAIIGYFRFKYVYGNETTGVILGAFLGYAASYYIPEEFALPFLPSLLSHPSIVISTILGGSIGAFSGVFEEGFKLKEREAASAMEVKIEQFEDAVAILKNRGFDIYTNDYKGKLFAFFEKLAAHPNAKNDPNIRQEIIAIRKQFDADPTMAMLELLFEGDNSKRKVPDPPYYIFSNHGDECQKFTSTASMYRFAKNLESGSKLLN